MATGPNIRPFGSPGYTGSVPPPLPTHAALNQLLISGQLNPGPAQQKMAGMAGNQSQAATTGVEQELKSLQSLIRQQTQYLSSIASSMRALQIASAKGAAPGPAAGGGGGFLSRREYRGLFPYGGRLGGPHAFLAAMHGAAGLGQGIAKGRLVQSVRSFDILSAGVQGLIGGGQGGGAAGGGGGGGWVQNLINMARGQGGGTPAQGSPAQSFQRHHIEQNIPFGGKPGQNVATARFTTASGQTVTRVASSGASASSGAGRAAGMAAGAGRAAAGAAGAAGGGGGGAGAAAGAAGAAGAGGAAIAGLGAAAVAIAVPVALAAFIYALKEAADGLIEFQRELAKVSPSMAQVYAIRDIQEMVRERKRGEQLSESAGLLVREEQRYKDSIFPMEAAWQELKNNFLGGFYSNLADLADTAGEISKTLGIIERRQQAQGTDTSFSGMIHQIADEAQSKQRAARDRAKEKR